MAGFRKAILAGNFIWSEKGRELWYPVMAMHSPGEISRLRLEMTGTSGRAGYAKLTLRKETLPQISGFSLPRCSWEEARRPASRKTRVAVALLLLICGTVSWLSYF